MTDFNLGDLAFVLVALLLWITAERFLEHLKDIRRAIERLNDDDQK